MKVSKRKLAERAGRDFSGVLPDDLRRKRNPHQSCTYSEPFGLG